MPSGHRISDSPQGRILVAEDDAHNQKLIKIMLEKLGCYVTLVSNGREAVDQFYDTPIIMI